MNNVDNTIRKDHERGVAAVKMAFRQVIYDIMKEEGMSFEEARQEFAKRLKEDVRRRIAHQQAQAAQAAAQAAELGAPAVAG